MDSFAYAKRDYDSQILFLSTLDTSRLFRHWRGTFLRCVRGVILPCAVCRELNGQSTHSLTLTAVMQEVMDVIRPSVAEPTATAAPSAPRSEK